MVVKSVPAEGLFVNLLWSNAAYDVNDGFEIQSVYER